MAQASRRGRPLAPSPNYSEGVLGARGLRPLPSTHSPLSNPPKISAVIVPPHMAKS